MGLQIVSFFSKNNFWENFKKFKILKDQQETGLLKPKKKQTKKNDKSGGANQNKKKP